MTPSDAIKRRIVDLAEGLWCENATTRELIAEITKIVDEAVREAITITAKVLK